MAKAELVQVLGSARFRQLFTVRLTGQFCDGLFQSALATFVLFSPERQTSAAAIATAFAILYLPYSLIGPFAGVFLDRWSRRQVLLYGNLLRTLMVAVIAYVTAQGESGMTLGILVLIALGINRFILAGLSAALPHTVDSKVLITANAFAPTAGTIAAAVGGLAGIAVRAAAGGNDRGSVVTLIVAGLGFGISGLLALRMPKTLLGPDSSEISETFRGVLVGLVDGARVLARATGAFRAVLVTTAHRVAFGLATVVVILLLRNTLNPPTDPDAALKQISLVIGGAAGGALLAAVVTPFFSRKFGYVVWSSATLIIAGVVTPLGIAAGSINSLIIGGVAIGLTGQAVKICADTEVQRELSDDHRGRAFSLYDISVNIGLVIGVALAAFSSPTSGQSVLENVLLAVILLGTAALYLATSRHLRARA